VKRAVWIVSLAFLLNQQQQQHGGCVPVVLLQVSAFMQQVQGSKRRRHVTEKHLDADYGHEPTGVRAEDAWRIP
jgi:hypothetical protein